MTSLKRFVCGLLSLSLPLFLLACGGGGGGGDQGSGPPVFSPQGTSNTSRQGSFTFEVPARGTARAASLIPSTAQKIEVTLRILQRKPGFPKVGEDLISRTVTLSNQTQKTTITGLDPGTWWVSMSAQDGDGTVLTQTTNSFSVKASENTEVPLTLGLVISADGKSITPLNGPLAEGTLLTLRNLSASMMVASGNSGNGCSFALGALGYLACPLVGDRYLVMKEFEAGTPGVTILEGLITRSPALGAIKPGIAISRGILSPLQKADAGGFAQSGSLILDWGDGSFENVGGTGESFSHQYARPGFYKLSVRSLVGAGGLSTISTISVLDEDPLGTEFYFRPNDQISLFDQTNLDQVPVLLELKNTGDSEFLQINSLSQGLGISVEGDSPSVGAELCPGSSLAKSVIVRSAGQKLCVRGALGGYLVEVTSFYPNLKKKFSCSGTNCALSFGEIGLKRLQKLPAISIVDDNTR